MKTLVLFVLRSAVSSRAGTLVSMPGKGSIERDVVKQSEVNQSSENERERD